MDTAQYLKRIHAKNTGSPSLYELTRLQYKHMLYTPFENLDISRGIWIPLDVDHYFEKIVEGYRGGFCYELNGLFHWLLKQLGYDSKLVSSRISKSDGSWTMDGIHISIIVELDQPYLVDVGFGDSARKPIPLSGERVTDISGSYHIEKVTEEVYDLKRNGRTVFRFDTIARNLEDFEKPCHFVQTSPDSPFRQKTTISIATLYGRLTLTDNTFKSTQYDQQKEKTVNNKEYENILKQYFYMKYFKNNI